MAQGLDDALVRLDDVFQRLAIGAAQDADEREQRHDAVADPWVQRRLDAQLLLGLFAHRDDVAGLALVGRDRHDAIDRYCDPALEQ